VGGNEVETPVAPPEAAPAEDTKAAPAWPRRLAWGAGFVVAGLALFAAYLRQARTVPVMSDGASNALQAWDMLHGNVLLRGWTMSDVSFYTTELPQYLLIELARGLNADVVHIAAAMSYTLMVAGAALLARGRATGREGATRMLIAAGIMLAPSLGTGTITLLSNPDHTGTQVPMLVIWLILDRVRPRWWVPLLAAVGLAWVQVADPLVLYEGVVPLVVVCTIRMYRRGGALRENWYELSLTAGAILSAGAAAAALKVIHHLGGFTTRPPNVAFAVVHTMYSNVWVAVESVLLLFGGDFSGARLGPHAAIALIHLAGVALAVWATVRALRRFGRQDLVVQLLAVTAVVLLAAYILRGNPDVAGSSHEIAGILPVGAVLAGRLLAEPLIRGRLIPALALIGLGYSAILVHNAVHQRPEDPNAQVATWLAANHLSYGLGDYWNANAITVDSGNQVKVAAVSRVGHKLIYRPWESDDSWYDAAKHNATFLVAPGPAKACSAATPGYWASAAEGTYGLPSATYQVAGFEILVWPQNLLAQLATGPPHAPVNC
jgi:hypothetical protein